LIFEIYFVPLMPTKKTIMNPVKIPSYPVMEKIINSDAFKFFVKIHPKLMYNIRNMCTKNKILTPDANNHKEGVIGQFFKENLGYDNVQTIFGENAKDIFIYNTSISIKCAEIKLKKGKRKRKPHAIEQGSPNLTLIWDTNKLVQDKYLANYNPKYFTWYFEVFVNNSDTPALIPSIYIFPPEVQDLSLGTQRHGRGLGVTTKTLDKWKKDPRTIIFDCVWPPYKLVENGCENMYKSVLENTMKDIS